MNSCEERRCRFWSGDYCTDEPPWVDPETGDDVCRRAKSLERGDR